jgi:hypothetical protein
MTFVRRLILSAVLLAAIAPASALAEERHSGRVVAVDPGAGTVRIEEMLAWKGPDSGVVERTLRLAPRTVFQTVRRSEDPARWPNAWEARPITVEALRPGDFVTAITGGDDVATTLEVVQPEG